MSNPPLPSPSTIADALLAGDSATVLDAVSRYMSFGGAPFLVDALAHPVMEQVGERWHAGTASVADEHAASELLREIFSTLLPSLAWHQGGPKAVVTCAPGEQHLLGARLISQVLALDGWRVRFLGAAPPAKDLALFVAREQPVFVGLSVTMADHIPAARTALEWIHRTAPQVRLVAGGSASEALMPAEKETWAVLSSTQDLLWMTRGGTDGLIVSR
ncbi:cobalamin B12-binding domain-containing protein [Stigmatella aurantiaca]|uniref:Probable transcriptional regulator, putative n=1 Tax=Stigmatella aurantiaca (strain DW4/3-1) TaxID=378806 RepID=Q08ZT4_STIAD|nr:cobalamin-dependent protein [Stigmatella aurantiaca]EAU65992.1 probable transcriptional regulator, putative [Stigmatella aurantiaca DW4/3-1]